MKNGGAIHVFVAETIGIRYFSTGAWIEGPMLWTVCGAVPVKGAGAVVQERRLGPEGMNVPCGKCRCVESGYICARQTSRPAGFGVSPKLVGAP